MIGDAPNASVAFADWVVTTLLVIYESIKSGPPGRTRAQKA